MKGSSPLQIRPCNQTDIKVEKCNLAELKRQIFYFKTLKVDRVAFLNAGNSNSYDSGSAFSEEPDEFVEVVPRDLLRLGQDEDGA